MRRTLILSISVLAWSAGAFAQALAGFGAVTGIIRDQYGEGLPDTTVVLYNESLGFQRSMTTTDDGVFDANAVVPGTGYGLKVTRKGYNGWETKNLEVSLGRTLNFRINLQPGTTAAQVEATVAAPPLDDTKTGSSTLTTTAQVDGLPSNGRVLDKFVLLAPAVNEDRPSGVLAFRGEAFTNSFLTDGNDTTNTYYLRKPGIAPQITPDAVSEMQVLTAAPSAEYGSTMGGIVNAVTRSGSNGLHGALYDYYNPRGWNASDRFAPGFKPDLRYNDAGVSVGGPVEPGKAFAFASFENLTADSQGLNKITSPLIANSLSTAVLASNCKATTAQCNTAINFLNPQFNSTVARSQHTMTGFGKVDYRPSETNSLSVEVNAMHRDSPDGAESETVAPNGGLLGYNSTYSDETRFARASLVSVINGAVNEVRGGWYRDRFSSYSDAKLLPSTGTVSINIAGVLVGANPADPSVLSEQRFEVGDNLTWTVNTHTMKFGGGIYRNQDWLDELYGQHGIYNYASLTTFAQDFSGNPLGLKNYMSYTQTLGNPFLNLHTLGYQGYAQDTWRATRRLMVTYGVRYEKARIPQPSEPNTSFYQSASIGSPSTDFAPRVGLSYRLDEHTVVRGGLGVYYEPFVGQLLATLFADNNVYQNSISVNPNQTGAVVFPKVLTTVPNGTPNVAYAATKFRNPYTEQATVAIERELMKDTTLTVSYINSRGIKLWTASDLNLTPTTTTKTYTIDDVNNSPVGSYSTLIWTAKDNTGYAHTYQIENEGESRYHAIAVELRKHLSHGLTVQGSYTWSHATDDMSGPPTLGFIPATTFPGDYRGDQAASAFDQRNRAVINWTWSPHVISGDTFAARYLLNGWQISGIATLASSLPETPLVLVMGQQFTGTTMLYTTSLNGSGGWSRAPFLGVNSYQTGSQHTVDLRVTRTLPFTDRLKGMLMIEAFNAFNSQFTTSVNTLAYTATAGVLHPVAGAGEPNASYGYPYGTNARRADVAFRLVF